MKPIDTVEMLELDLGVKDPIGRPGHHRFVRIIFNRDGLPKNYRSFDLHQLKDWLLNGSSQTGGQGHYGNCAIYAPQVEDFEWGPPLPEVPGLISHKQIMVDDRRTMT